MTDSRIEEIRRTLSSPGWKILLEERDRQLAELRTRVDNLALSGKSIELAGVGGMIRGLNVAYTKLPEALITRITMQERDIIEDMKRQEDEELAEKDKY